MDPDKIILESVDKLFEYEMQSRIIDSLDSSELKKFSKLYLKLYLKQQETLNLLGQI